MYWAKRLAEKGLRNDPSCVEWNLKNKPDSTRLGRLQGEVRSSSVPAEPVDVHRVPGVSDGLRARAARGLPRQERLPRVFQRDHRRR